MIMYNSSVHGNVYNERIFIINILETRSDKKNEYLFLITVNLQ